MSQWGNYRHIPGVRWVSLRWPPSVLARPPSWTVMIPVWKLKVHLEDISKDSQFSEGLGDYEIIGRNWKKFDLTKSCLKMMQRFLIDNKTKHLLKVVDKTSKNKKWWQPNLSRFEAEKYLQCQDIGAFVVRIGNGKNFFALSLKSEEHHFDHYKIELYLSLSIYL